MLQTRLTSVDQHVANRGNQSTDQRKSRDSPYEEKSPKGFPTGPKKDRASAQQCAVLRSSYWDSAIQLTNVPLYHIRIYATHSLYFTCPQGLRTDHPVLVYKACEFSGIVLRLFSCLPPRVPPLSPSAHSSSSSSFVFAYHKSSFGTVTSNFKPLSPPTTPLSSELRQDMTLCSTSSTIVDLCTINSVGVVLCDPKLNLLSSQ